MQQQHCQTYNEHLFYSSSFTEPGVYIIHNAKKQNKKKTQRLLTVLSQIWVHIMLAVANVALSGWSQTEMRSEATEVMSLHPNSHKSQIFWLLIFFEVAVRSRSFFV